VSAIRRLGSGAIAAVVVVALIVALVIVVSTGGAKQNKLTAYFPTAIGLYNGNDVRVMGVKIGHVDSITPDGPVVKVEMTYNADVKVPDVPYVQAVVFAPSIVSDRYVQLTGTNTNTNTGVVNTTLTSDQGAVYHGGPTLPNNAVLGCNPQQTEAAQKSGTTPACKSQTAVPLELDAIFGGINKLDVALGPNGANKKGALSDLLKVGAANLKGNGQAFNQALSEFSQAISTLAGSKGDLFGTVNNLQKFTSTLASDDGGVRALNANLAKVGSQLSAERTDLGDALSNLASALTAVNTFVAQNRNNLTGDIHGLASVTNVLSKEKEAITQFTDLAPLALSDLSLSYDPEAQTLDTKGDLTVPLTKSGPSGTLCQLLSTIGLSAILGAIEGCGATSNAVTAVTSTNHTAPSLSELLKGTG
jgi:phospholipid/cholesterol/gamma-HCH transport system substrate-binding protein